MRVNSIWLADAWLLRNRMVRKYNRRDYSNFLCLSRNTIVRWIRKARMEYLEIRGGNDA